MEGRRLTRILGVATRKPFEAGLLLLYIVWVAIQVACHEPWRDEAQAWFIARDLSLSGILDQVGYEGTPALWHLILAGLERLSLPFQAMGVVHGSIAATAMGIFCFAAPFPRFIKAVTCASYYFVYEYATVSRSYVLSVLALFGIAALYRRRHERPFAYAFFVVVLVNANVMCFALSGLLVAVYGMEWLSRRPRPIRPGVAAALMGAGILAALYQLWQPTDSRYVGFFHEVPPSNLLRALRHGILPDPAFDFAERWRYVGVFVLIVILAVVRRPVLLLLALGQGAWLAYIFAFQKVGSLRHYGFFLLLFVFVLWLEREGEGGRWPDRIAARFAGLRRFGQAWVLAFQFLIYGALIVSIPYGIRTGVDDVRLPFTDGPDAASYVARHHPDAVVAVDRGDHCLSVQLRLPDTEFWKASIQDYGTFVTRAVGVHEAWLIDEDEVFRRIQRHFGDRKPVLLFRLPLTDPAARGYRLAYASGDRPLVRWGVYGTGERFFIYAPSP